MNKIEKWTESFENDLEGTVDQAEKEIDFPGLSFCDWRISYGTQVAARDEDGWRDTIYFLSFRPAFCVGLKKTFFYKGVDVLAKDVVTIQDFLLDVEKLPEDAKEINVSDIIATTFAILNDKESIELYSDQKGLMELGLKHYHLDNYYQNLIKRLCSEYYARGTVIGKPFHISLFNR